MQDQVLYIPDVVTPSMSRSVDYDEKTAHRTKHTRHTVAIPLDRASRLSATRSPRGSYQALQRTVFSCNGFELVPLEDRGDHVRMATEFCDLSLNFVLLAAEVWICGRLVSSFFCSSRPLNFSIGNNVGRIHGRVHGVRNGYALGLPLERPSVVSRADRTPLRLDTEHHPPFRALSLYFSSA